MSKEAMKLALEALESCGWNDGYAGENQYFHDDLVDKAIASLREALAKEPAPVQGWKLVPVKPTTEMIDALADTDPEHDSVWSAVLAAAPQPAQQQPVALLNAIRAEPTEMIHRWRVIDIIQSYPPQGIYY